MLGTDAPVLLQDKCIFPWRVLVQYRAEFPVQFPYHFVLQEYMMGGGDKCVLNRGNTVMESACEGVVAFCEVVLLAVVAEYQENDDDNSKECLLEMLELALPYLVLLDQHLGADSTLLIALMQQILRLISSEHDLQNSHTTQRGRPKVEVDKDRLIFLKDCGFKTKDIASFFGCSAKTIERRINEYAIPRRCDVYCAVTDSELDEKVFSIVSFFPQCGQKSVDGRLKSAGVSVSRKRLRESLRRVDPMGVESRIRHVLHRRPYSVPSPNDLWHIDGYHKLIRWRIVIHGGIDGYSRMIMFLQAATNNRADTMLCAFRKGVTEFGLPSRVRMDKGGENVLVAQYMIQHPERGSGRGSVIVGRSIHNQRIERLWRDLFSGCISLFYYFFHFLEDIGLLNMNDELDVHALHCAFLPMIQDELDSFRSGWSQHCMRTENNRTPMQLWVTGLLETNREMLQQHPPITETDSVSCSVCQQ